MSPKPKTEAAKPQALEAILTPLARNIRTARRVGTPLIGITTPDPAGTIATLASIMKEDGDLAANDVPVLAYDRVRGVRALNDAGSVGLGKLIKEAKLQSPAQLVSPVQMIDALAYAPMHTVVYIIGAHTLMTDHEFRQGVWNLRDLFKADSRTLILLGPSLNLTADLEGDTILFDEPLPNRDQARALILQQFKNAEIEAPEADVLEQAVDAVIGLSAFTIEQITAMSLRKKGIDLDALWERKRHVINQTPGLKVWNGGEAFEGIGGCENIKSFSGRLIDGEERFSAVVFIDEIEKQIAGSGGDTSGTSGDQLMQLLTFMQDKKSSGLMFVGHPGTAKSVIAKAIGNAAGVPTIQFDLGGMKDQFVGSSEARIRNALKVVDAVSTGRALFVATCNQIHALPPELRRRFKAGTFFFDLPTAEERASIWQIYIDKFKLSDEQIAALRAGTLDETEWTGAEIEQCCDLAWRLRTTVADAAQYIVPVARASAQRVEMLRTEAAGKIISASKPGVYEVPSEKTPVKLSNTGGTRRLRVD